MRLEIHTNLSDVRRRIESLQRDLPKEVTSITQLAQWDRTLRSTARRVLGDLAGPGHEDWVNAFMRALNVVFFTGGFEAVMGGPDAATFRVEDAVSVERQLTTRTYADVERRRRTRLTPDVEQTAALDNARAVIEEWVRSEKRRSDIDEGLTDAEVAQRITMIIFGSGRDSVSGRRSPEMDAARERLVSAIDAWLEENEFGGELDPEIVRAWMRAVLDAWRDLVLRDLPLVVEQRIKAIMEGAKEKLI